MNKKFDNFPTISFVNEKSYETLVLDLKKNNFHIFKFEGDYVKDAKSFFAKAVNVFPQEPPLTLRGGCKWDALVDSLWGGLDELSKERVAVIWTKAENMLDGGLPDLVIALDCFKQLASTVDTIDYGISTPMQLLVFLVGNGNNFKLFD